MSSRGRNNNRRGTQSRASSQVNDRPPRRRSYEDIEAEAKQQRQSVENKVAEVNKQQLPKPDETKKTNLVTKGQQWFNKFFGGIKRRERGNMQLEFNTDLDLQIYDVYSFKLSNMAFTRSYYDDFAIKLSGPFFRVYLDFLIGIKLLKANTDTGKVMLKEFQPLVHFDLKIPKNLGALINGLGKTDVAGENVVRIIGQNSIVKTMFFKSVMLCCYHDKNRFYNNMTFSRDVTFNRITKWVKENLLTKKVVRIYTDDKAGVDLLHSYGKKAIEFVNKLDIDVGSDGVQILCRVPYFDESRSQDVNYIIDWATKIQSFFTAIKFSSTEYMKTLGYALIGWFPVKFLKNKKTAIGKLDDRFKDTIFKDVTPEAILLDQNWTSLSDWMDDRMLYDNTVMVIDYYKSSIEHIYEDMFHMVKFDATEFGNGSQICIINDHKDQYIDFYDDQTLEFGQADNRVPANVHARITDEEAVIGSVFDFNVGIFIENSFDVRTIGSAHEIRLAYLGHDFK